MNRKKTTKYILHKKILNLKNLKISFDNCGIVFTSII